MPWGRISNVSGVEGQRRFAPAARDIGDALRFFTRVPVGDPGASAPLDINRFAWAAPVAGAAVGLIGALALALTGLIGLPPLMRAGLATAALVAAAGGLHEDGLADVADGFGGGGRRLLARFAEPDRRRRALARRGADPARPPRPGARRRRGRGGRPA